MKIYIIIATVAWMTTIYKFNTLRKQRQDKRIATMGAFALFIALSTTCRTPVVSSVLDRHTFWMSSFLTYIFNTLAIFSITLNSYYVARITPRRRLLPLLIITAVLITATFSFGAAGGDDLMRSHMITVMYAYITVMGLVTGKNYNLLRRTESVLPSRIRWSATLLVVVLMVGFSASRVAQQIFILIAAWRGLDDLLFPILTFNPWEPIQNFFLKLSYVFLVPAGVLWPLAIAPNRFYLALSRFVMFCETVLTLKDLKRLRGRLNRLFPPLIPHQITWRELLANPDWHLCQLMVDILDSKRMLVSHFQSGFSTTNRWDDKTTEEAICLYSALQQTPEKMDFKGQVAFYRDLSRRLE